MMAELAPYISIFLGVLILSFLATGLCIKISKKIGLVATPNDRTLHSGDKPLGGGAPVIGLSLIAWYFLAGPLEAVHVALLAGTIILASISLIDDFDVVRASIRFSLQFLVVAGCLYFLPDDQYVIWSQWPIYVDRLVTGFCWLWFINLYNFMDGIDGLASTETIAICIGVVLIGSLVGLQPALVILAALLAFSMAGFLPWNWYKSRIMLGDFGAVPTGFLLGFLLINLAMEGYLIAALLLPLYFVADASITLIGRVFRGEEFWTPHNKHFYQKATKSGLRHDQVVYLVIAANIIFVSAAWLSLSNMMLAISIAVLTLGLLLLYLFMLSRRPEASPKTL